MSNAQNMLTDEEAEELRAALVGEPEAVADWHERTGHEAPTLLAQHDEIARLRAEAPSVLVDAASTEQMLAAALVLTYMAGEAGEDFRCWHEAHTEEWLENHAHALELLDYRWPRWEKSARKLLKLIGYSEVNRG